MEYGSVLELDDLSKYKISEEPGSFTLPFMKNKSCRPDINFYQSGRNAIEELLLFLKKKKGINKVIIPDFVCQTVKDAAVRASVETDEYIVNKDYEYSVKEIDSKIGKDSCVYLCHFFGQPISEDVICAAKRWMDAGTIVIEDITLSLLSENPKGVGFGNYILGSIRKWFPIPDGGFLSAYNSELPKEPEKNSVSKYTDYYMVVQTLKREYITGGCKDKALKDVYMSYYGLSIKELFSDYRIYPMSEWSYNYLQNVSVEEVLAKRIENYDCLYDRLKGIKGIQLKKPRKEGYLPFGMVLDVSDRDDLLNYLIQNDIYCNVHWRLGSSAKNPDLEYLSGRSITVPCDQRYTKEDMEHIAKVIEKRYK